jgi:putative iron-regulated protein
MALQQMRNRSFARVVLLCSGFAVACRVLPSEASSTLDETQARAAQQTYAELAAAGYADATRGARELLLRVDELLDAPSPATLARAREAWLAARKPYAQTEVFRFYDGPIDKVELLVNTWPIDENYVESELVNGAERYHALSPELLTSINMRDGETSVSTGYHVIEFLLWGRDTNPDGPGQRSHLDYARDPDPKLERRRAYLHSVTALLVEHLAGVTAAWAHDRPGNYRAQFLALPPRAALALVIKGMGSLSGPELSGERLIVPYETKHQQNEHSCFSDNTLADLVGNAQGVDNVCRGRYRDSAGRWHKGLGLCAALASLAGQPSARLSTETAASVSALQAVPEPFDRAILGADDAPSRKAIAAAIKALQTQTETLAELAQALQVGLTPVRVQRHE